MTDRIVLTGMRFYGYHGVLPEETKLGQTFLIDLELYLNLSAAGETDDLEQTINYGLVYEKVKAIVEGRPFKLIEALAERLAQEVISTFSPEEIVVRVHKPKAPIAGPFENVTVEIRRRRAL